MHRVLLSGNWAVITHRVPWAPRIPSLPTPLVDGPHLSTVCVLVSVRALVKPPSDRLQPLQWLHVCLPLGDAAIQPMFSSWLCYIAHGDLRIFSVLWRLQIIVDKVTVVLPNWQRELVTDLSLRLGTLSDSVLVVGSSGVGKTAILRTIAGLWQSGRGVFGCRRCGAQGIPAPQTRRPQPQMHSPPNPRHIPPSPDASPPTPNPKCTYATGNGPRNIPYI